MVSLPSVTDVLKLTKDYFGIGRDANIGATDSERGVNQGLLRISQTMRLSTQMTLETMQRVLQPPFPSQREQFTRLATTLIWITSFLTGLVLIFLNFAASSFLLIAAICANGNKEFQHPILGKMTVESTKELCYMVAPGLFVFYIADTLFHGEAFKCLIGRGRDDPRTNIYQSALVPGIAALCYVAASTASAANVSAVAKDILRGKTSIPSAVLCLINTACFIGNTFTFGVSIFTDLGGNRSVGESDDLDKPGRFLWLARVCQCSMCASLGLSLSSLIIGPSRTSLILVLFCGLATMAAVIASASANVLSASLMKSSDVANSPVESSGVSQLIDEEREDATQLPGPIQEIVPPSPSPPSEAAAISGNLPQARNYGSI